MEITKDWLLGNGFKCHQSDEGIYFRNGDIGIIKSFNVWLPFKIIGERALWPFVYIETREQLEKLLIEGGL